MKTFSYGSVCSGIEAVSVAWQSLPFQASWFSEITPFPSALLVQRWPSVPNLGDMQLLANQVLDREIVAPDVIVGGTPCQAFSVVGKRAGLNDFRGQLTLRYIELVNAIDEMRGINHEEPTIAVWENVPGVLSDKTNAFGCFIGALSGEVCPLLPPERTKRWSRSGLVIGRQRMVAWRVLDAQYFGLAQRRKRVFVVASARKGFDPAQVLFESLSMQKSASSVIKRTPTSAITIRNGAQIPFSRSGFVEFTDSNVGSTLTARFKSDLIVEPAMTSTGMTWKVRKMTPIEVERLQGFPDNYTNIEYKGSEAKDYLRFTALGNSMAVPVMKWIGERILMNIRD